MDGTRKSILRLVDLGIRLIRGEFSEVALSVACRCASLEASPFLSLFTFVLLFAAGFFGEAFLRIGDGLAWATFLLMGAAGRGPFALSDAVRFPGGRPGLRLPATFALASLEAALALIGPSLRGAGRRSLLWIDGGVSCSWFSLF